MIGVNKPKILFEDQLLDLFQKNRLAIWTLLRCHNYKDFLNVFYDENQSDLKQKALTHFISKDPLAACWYAILFDEQFPEGETAISTNDRAAYMYASNILGKRWPEGEQAILNGKHYILYYAMYVIKGRWPEAEPFIAMNWQDARLYTKQIIKTRFYYLFDCKTLEYWRANKFQRFRIIIKGLWYWNFNPVN